MSRETASVYVDVLVEQETGLAYGDEGYEAAYADQYLELLRYFDVEAVAQ